MSPVRGCYSEALYLGPDATLSELREAVATLEEMERAARRVFGGAHPLAAAIEETLRDALSRPQDAAARGRVRRFSMIHRSPTPSSRRHRITT